MKQAMKKGLTVVMVLVMAAALLTGCGKDGGQKISDALSGGKLVVALMSKGHFTTSGHFIDLRGIENGKILVADPASYKKSEQAWDLSLIIDEAREGAAAGGPFWIIG